MVKTMQDKETKEKNLYSDLQRRMLGKDVKQRMENKMQDSQKAKDELWNRLWKEFGQLVYMEGMNEHVKRGANGDLVDFIASEISKARKEGRREILSLVEDLEETNLDGEEWWRIWSAIEKTIIKLSNKK